MGINITQVCPGTVSKLVWDDDMEARRGKNLQRRFNRGCNRGM